MSSHSHVVYKSSKNYNNTDTSLGRNMMRSAKQAPYLERKKEHDLALRWKNNVMIMLCTKLQRLICV
uniref:Uncharacterized protein n=1 Tax=Bartonella rochalimae ATCC BAA-1498 TaxID=685782 RepID=E6YNF6_9HYPH|nr:hypothetical protein BARRO_130038 [Bartonella rochalimae ATCC BAA-1498]